jgi:ABC-type Na+ efflux pump permease subunit
MKIRELLQYELWSKRTTRKILVGIGIVVAVVALGLGAWSVVSRVWLTPEERRAARIALKQVDALQSTGSLSNEEYAKLDGQATKSVDDALQAALTRRDRAIARKLLIYETVTTLERFDAERAELAKQRHLPPPDSDPIQRESMDSIRSIEGSNSSRVLHQILD